MILFRNSHGYTEKCVGYEESAKTMKKKQSIALYKFYVCLFCNGYSRELISITSAQESGVIWSIQNNPTNIPAATP